MWVCVYVCKCVYVWVCVYKYVYVEISLAETMCTFGPPVLVSLLFFCILQNRKGSVTDGHTLPQTLLKDASRIKNILENIILNNSSVCVEHTRFAACNFGLVLAYRCIIKAEYCRGYFSNTALIYFRLKEKAIFVYIWCKNVK